MAYAIGEIITLGIGTPSDISSIILVGLAPPSAPPSTGSGNNALTGLSTISAGGDIEEL